MDKIINQFFSMKMMALAMLTFLVAIGAATFLESIYDIQTAKLLIYNATWFEILLTYLALNLISNIFRYNLLRREKIATLTFHLSFLVILVGAAITRFISFEGLMMVREGEKSNFIYSSDPYLWFKINDGVNQYTYDEKMYQSELMHNTFDFDVEFPNHKTPVSISFVDFQKKCIDSLVINDSIKGSALEIVSGGMTSNYLTENDFIMVGEIAVSYNKKDAMPGIHLSNENGIVYVTSAYDLRYLAMTQMQEARRNGNEVPDSAYITVPKNTKSVLQSASLYQVEDQQFVFKGLLKNAKKMLVPSGSKKVGNDYLTIKVTDGTKEKIAVLMGGMGALPEHNTFEFNGLIYEFEYGSKHIPVPFSIACRDFQLDRYPGSMSPSSFASELTIVDPKNGVTENKRVFMNSVLDYRGYRFFQSGYSEDEMETHLSVNHDAWGTNVTYLGYLLMAIGMILSLFAPAGRFREIGEKLSKIQARKELLTLLAIVSFTAMGQTDHVHVEGDTTHQHEEEAPVLGKRQAVKAEFISKEHAADLSSLAVQDFKGRIIPMHTMCDELLRKISRKSSFDDYNAVQTVISMHMYPEYWMDQDVIYVPSNIADRLKLKGKYCSFYDFFDDKMNLIAQKEYNDAFRRPESKRDEFDKKLITTIEKIQVLNQIFMWEYMKIVPDKNDKAHKWYAPISAEIQKVGGNGSELAKSYFVALAGDARSNNFSNSDKILANLKAFQRSEGSAVIPAESKFKTEILYNKLNIFKWCERIYLTLGVLMLISFFIKIVRNPKGEQKAKYDKINKYVKYGLLLSAVFHASGLGMRWYITGHAPWSNGYEAIVFIALVTMIAGFIFSKRNAAVLAATAVLAFLMLFVSDMNMLNPEITPLQPVLKSYWLMIHVAIITGSYGFLGLGGILSLLNLSLYTVRNEKNGKRITLDINELTYIAEMTITVGLFMLTIGTFLGGIWANESWGRYWGWDPKETWALVSVLVYAIILHFRFIPGLSSKFTFNVASLWGYSAILFTFFGVNFYLVGLHSYAQGDGLAEIPTGLIIAVLIFVAFTIFAYIKYRGYKKLNGKALD